jgi:hypothetical protein
VRKTNRESSSVVFKSCCLSKPSRESPTQATVIWDRVAALLPPRLVASACITLKQNGRKCYCNPLSGSREIPLFNFHSSSSRRFSGRNYGSCLIVWLYELGSFHNGLRFNCGICWGKETGEVVIITDVSAATLGKSGRQQRRMAWTVGICLGRETVGGLFWTQ